MVASSGLVPGQWWYSDQTYLGDLWTYVHPDVRRGRVADELIELNKAVADRFRATLCLAVSTTRDTARKDALYRRHMTPFGQSFIYQGG